MLVPILKLITWQDDELLQRVREGFEQTRVPLQMLRVRLKQWWFLLYFIFFVVLKNRLKRTYGPITFTQVSSWFNNFFCCTFGPLFFIQVADLASCHTFGLMKWYGTKSATFCKDMRPKLQQKKLWDQIETWAKVMRPKLQQKKLWD